MRWWLAFFILLVFKINSKAQVRFEKLEKVELDSGIILTFDEPKLLDPGKPTKLIIYALPNGNTTAQTFGKKLKAGDDWHFDIQHIGAQTTFIRNHDTQTNYIVVYLENNLKSWPAWRRVHVNSNTQISQTVEDLFKRYQKYQPKITLSSHSGGGSFIFGYLNAQDQIPAEIERIGFLDATYAYETAKHAAKLKKWLKKPKHSLQVMAYNDSVVVFQGKPLVSPTGGTWYRSKLMAADLKKQFNLKELDLPDRLSWSDSKHRIVFSLIKNPEGKIYHTVLVEKNGFIELIFGGTKFQNRGYTFWEERAYLDYIQP